MCADAPTAGVRIVIGLIGLVATVLAWWKWGAPWGVVALLAVLVVLLLLTGVSLARKIEQYEASRLARLDVLLGEAARLRDELEAFDAGPRQVPLGDPSGRTEYPAETNQRRRDQFGRRIDALYQGASECGVSVVDAAGESASIEGLIERIRTARLVSGQKSSVDKANGL